MALTEELTCRLLAYVDGQLNEVQLAETKTLLKLNPEAAEFVRLLETSEVPYDDAFAHQLAEPLPKSIVEYVRTFRADKIGK